MPLRIRKLLKGWHVGPYPGIALLLAILVGALIPPQGNALRALGNVIGSNPLAAAISLFGGTIVFLISLSFGGSQIAALLEKDTRKWYFLVSGTPGACFIAFFSQAMRVAGPVEAALAAVFGLTLFVFTRWRTLGNAWPYAACCITLVLAGTWLASGAGIVAMPSDLGILLLGLTAISGFGVSWQFRTLGFMGDKSSVRAAGFISSLSGCISAIILHGIFVSQGWAPLMPSNPLPSPFGEDWWMYTCSPEGVLIILFGTYAAPKLKEIYPVVMVTGNLLSSVCVGLMTTVVVLTKLLLQITGVLLAILGVIINAFGAKIWKRITSPTKRELSRINQQHLRVRLLLR